MNLALDTQAYSDFCRGKAMIKQAVREAIRVVLPLIVLGELRAGFRAGTKSVENERTLQRFLNQRRVGIIAIDEDTTHHYARLFIQLRTQGTPIPTNDLWIASLIAQHDLTLFSDDAHFDHLPQLNRYS